MFWCVEDFVCYIPCAHVHCATTKGSFGQIFICYVIYNIHSIVQYKCIKHWAVDKYACLCSGALSKAKARDKSELGRCIWAKANWESNCCVFHHLLLHTVAQWTPTKCHSFGAESFCPVSVLKLLSSPPLWKLKEWNVYPSCPWGLWHYKKPPAIFTELLKQPLTWRTDHIFTKREPNAKQTRI